MNKSQFCFRRSFPILRFLLHISQYENLGITVAGPDPIRSGPTVFILFETLPLALELSGTLVSRVRFYSRFKILQIFVVLIWAPCH